MSIRAAPITSTSASAASATASRLRGRVSGSAVSASASLSAVWRFSRLALSAGNHAGQQAARKRRHPAIHEHRAPITFAAGPLWAETLVSSRLLEYELFVRLNVLGLATTHGEIARALIDRVSLVELSALVLGRVLEPFPRLVRTLDAFHLASMEFLRGRGRPVRLASYDTRLADAATRLGIPLFDLG